jgi:integration host factor subunit alpha
LYIIDIDGNIRFGYRSHQGFTGDTMAGSTVTRAQLSEAVYQEVGLSRNESADLVEGVLNEISDTLVRGESVKISSFGSFSVRQKGERKGRNPKTGEEVPIKPRRVLVFRASNVLKQKINSTINLSKNSGGETSGA